jgi:hypothetical protein
VFVGGQVSITNTPHQEAPADTAGRDAARLALALSRLRRLEAPLMPVRRRRTIPVKGPRPPPSRRRRRRPDVLRRELSLGLLAPSAAAQLPGTLAVRPGRDRARPARAARSVVVPVARLGDDRITGG